ncbi:uncharacterized protein [Dysidea avara]|uniref:uncharacterized protein n=1 Tax=Dysidea avara TaxID=196820 RepID=UPI00332ADA23
MLLIKPSDNDIADGEIINSGVLVNFTASCYDIEVNETEAIVRVSVFGEFDTNFRVNVIAAASDQSEQSEAFFPEGANEGQFFVGSSTALVPIQVFPETLRSGIPGRFNVTLEAVDDGVFIGSPSEAVVKVPSPFV